MAATYTAKDITVLEGLEPVRKRPAMYIGSTDARGLHHLVWETLDNAVDEALNGYCTAITLRLEKDGGVTVVDNGRGIPVDIHPKTKRPAIETILCTLHAGGKFDHTAYKSSGGLHGVGVSVVNALSSWMRVESARDGGVWAQEYERGQPITKVERIAAQGHRRVLREPARAQQGAQQGLAHAHLRHVNPFPANTEAVLRAYRTVLVPELNLGQLRMLVRARFLIDAKGFNLVRGKPFKISEVEAEAERLLAVTGDR